MALKLSPQVEGTLSLVAVLVPDAAPFVNDLKASVADGSISFDEGVKLGEDATALAAKHVPGQGARFVQLANRAVSIGLEVEAAIKEFEASAPAPAAKPA
jgi:hypothetical protein